MCLQVLYLKLYNLEGEKHDLRNQLGNCQFDQREASGRML